MRYRRRTNRTRGRKPTRSRARRAHPLNRVRRIGYRL